MKQQTKTKILKGMWWTVGVLVVIVATLGYFIYQRLYSPNTRLQQDDFLYIPTSADFETVVSLLDEKHLLVDEATFRWTAQKMNYIDRIKPGRYKVKSGMSNRSLVTMLRAGKQVPVQLKFNTVRTKVQLTERVGEQLEVEHTALLHLLDDSDYLQPLGFTTNNALALFLPNTYEIYWNTSADQFIKRMKREYDKFWTADRMRKAKQAGLSPVEVSILASIVQQESNKEDDKPIIAGVYLNRYRNGWKLDADPTLIYAAGDFTITRVLNIHKSIDSPYNTYLYKGLPPGPICLPTQKSIDAVLNYTHHNYFYFCAREDFSGYHNFAATYPQHLVNASKFQRALDRRGIRN